MIKEVLQHVECALLSRYYFHGGFWDNRKPLPAVFAFGPNVINLHNAAK